MSVQVQASFKKDQRHLDGIDHVRKDLIDKPLQPRVAVIVFDVTSINHDVLDGSDTPKIRLRQAEVLDGADAITAINMLNRRYESRTGRTDSQATLFDEWDPGAATPEQHAAHVADAIGAAPAVDEDPRTAEEIMAERAEAKEAAGFQQDPDQGDDVDPDPDAGVPWSPEAESAPWPGDVEFTEPPAAAVEPDVASEPDARRSRRGRK